MEKKVKFIKGKETPAESLGISQKELDELNIFLMKLARKVMTNPDFNLDDGMEELVNTLSPEQVYMMAMNKFTDTLDELVDKFEAFMARKRENDDCDCPACQLRREKFGRADGKDVHNIDEILKHIKKK